MRLGIVISFLLAAPVLADAQFPAELQPGMRVRVWIPETTRQEQGPDRRQLLRGTVESVDGTLGLRVPGTVGSLAIPRASVRGLDVSRGRFAWSEHARARDRRRNRGHDCLRSPQRSTALGRTALSHRLARGGSRRGMGRWHRCRRRFDFSARTLEPRHPLTLGVIPAALGT